MIQKLKELVTQFHHILSEQLAIEKNQGQNTVSSSAIRKWRYQESTHKSRGMIEKHKLAFLILSE